MSMSMSVRDAELVLEEMENELKTLGGSPWDVQRKAYLNVQIDTYAGAINKFLQEKNNES